MPAGCGTCVFSNDTSTVRPTLDSGQQALHIRVLLAKSSLDRTKYLGRFLSAVGIP